MRNGNSTSGIDGPFYRRLCPASPLAPPCAGTEFHYSTILEQPDTALAEVRDADGNLVPETGSRRGYASGTFFHLITQEETL